MNQLEQLKQYTTIVADTGDFQSMKAFAPRDATTNPSLILKAVQKDEYKPLLEKAVREIGREVAGKRSSRVERIAGRLHATLSFGQIDEIMASGLHSYLDTVRRQCTQVHSALYQTYINYPVEAALSA